jgi:hypothetical protein
MAFVATTSPAANTVDASTKVYEFAKMKLNRVICRTSIKLCSEVFSMCCHVLFDHVTKKNKTLSDVLVASVIYKCSRHCNVDIPLKLLFDRLDINVESTMQQVMILSSRMQSCNSKAMYSAISSGVLNRVASIRMSQLIPGSPDPKFIAVLFSDFESFYPDIARKYREIVDRMDLPIVCKDREDFNKKENEFALSVVKASRLEAPVVSRSLQGAKRPRAG